MTLSMTFGWGHTDGEIRPIKDNGTEKPLARQICMFYIQILLVIWSQFWIWVKVNELNDMCSIQMVRQFLFGVIY